MTIPDLPLEGDTSWYDWATSLDTEARKVADKLDTATASATYVPSVVATGSGIDPTGVAASTGLQAKVTAAAGGEVFLPRGTYLLGASLNVPANTTVRGNGATLKLANGANVNLVQIADVSGVVLRDLTLDGNAAGQTDATISTVLVQHIGTASDVRVLDCRFLNAKDNALRTSGSGPASRLTVRGCHFEGGAAFAAVNSQNDDDAKVTDCTFTGIAGRGIYIGNPSIGGARAVVSGNRLTAITGFGIEVQNVAGAVISDNSLHALGSYGISIDTCNGASVTGNRLENVTGVAVEAVACDGVSITGNVVSWAAGDTTGSGVSVDRSTRVAIAGNSFSGFGVDGVHVAGDVGAASHVSVTGCTFVGANTTAAVGVRCLASNYVTVDGCAFLTMFVAVRGASADDITVTGGVMNGVSYGVYMDGCDDLRVTGVRMIGNGNEFGNGVSCVNANTGAGVVNCRVSGFTGTSAGFGVSLGASSDFVVVVGNDLRGNRFAINGTAATQQVANNN